MMQQHLLALALIFALPSTPAQQAQPEDVSIIQLIAAPEKYNGKFIRTSGYLHNQFEDSAIYFAKTDADYLIGENGLWIAYAENVQKQPLNRNKKVDSLRYFDCKYVLIEGFFNKDAHGHMGAFAGSIERVSRIMELTRWFDGSKRLKD
jgi:hypothetical protein